MAKSKEVKKEETAGVSFIVSRKALRNLRVECAKSDQSMTTAFEEWASKYRGPSLQEEN